MVLWGPSFSGKGQRGEPIAVPILLDPPLNMGRGVWGQQIKCRDTGGPEPAVIYSVQCLTSTHSDTPHTEGCSTLHGECDRTHTAAARDVFDIVL